MEITLTIIFKNGRSIKTTMSELECTQTIVEVAQNMDEDGTLFTYLSRCVIPGFQFLDTNEIACISIMDKKLEVD